MKTYEKPVLMALSLNANDRLCGDCADSGGATLYNNSGLAYQILWLTGRDSFALDGIQRSDFSGLFGTEEGCTTNTEGYCKFSSSGMLVAWS